MVSQPLICDYWHLYVILKSARRNAKLIQGKRHLTCCFESLFVAREEFKPKKKNPTNFLTRLII